MTALTQQRVAAPLTPSDLACATNSALRLSHDSAPLFVSGVYRRNERKQIYGGYYYDALRDPVSANSLTLRVPEGLRAHLHDGRAYTFRGSLVRRISDGELRIDLTFQVSAVESEVSTPEREADLVKRCDLFHRKTKGGFRPVEPLFRQRISKGDKPTVLLVHGVDAVVTRDVEASLGAAASAYHLCWRQIALRDPAAVTRLLRELDQSGADALGLIRGGGDLDAFDDLRLACAIVELKTPFVCALGHAADRTLVDQLADLSLPTPTALGEFLRRVAEQGCAGREQSQTAEQAQAEINRRAAQIEGWATQVSNEAGELALERQRLATESLQLRSFAADLDAREREADRTLAPVAPSAPVTLPDQMPSPVPVRRSARIALTIAFVLALGILLGAGIAFLVVALSRPASSSVTPPVRSGLSPLPLAPTPSAPPQPTTRPRGRDVRRRSSAPTAPRFPAEPTIPVAPGAASTGDTSSSALESRP